jgi:hypothetical protein
MQYSILNRASGNASRAIIEELRRVFTPNSKSILEVFNNSSTTQFLLESKSSPSYLELLRNKLVSSLTGTKTTDKVYKGKLKNIATKKLPISIKQPSNKNLIKKLKNIKNKVSSAKPRQLPVSAANAPSSLASLQSILDSQLVQRVKDNMGNGSRRDVLNLRSGRLAESAKVERLSESRAGMITAFYSYMKNPYATFSQGGRQQNPRSRDPKLLISKSIREIAATQVGNRLRAVLV